MPPKQPHHSPPTQPRKHRPRIPRHALLPPLRHHHHPAHAVPAVARQLHRQLRQRQHHPREHVDDDLLIDAALAAAAEDGVAADQTGEEGVVAAFARLGREGLVVQQEHAGFVEESEGREVAGVRARCFEDEPEFVARPVRRQRLVRVWLVGGLEKGRKGDKRVVAEEEDHAARALLSAG